MLSKSELKTIFPRARHQYIDALASGGDLLRSAGLLQPLAYAHFMARCAAETGGLAVIEESGNYSAQRLVAVWPKRFSVAEAKIYAHKPQSILNRAYARKELGNGPEWSGDGWRYRGRSFLQTTGRANYREMGEALGFDLERNPDLLGNDAVLGLKAAVFEWTKLGLTKIVCELGPTHAAALKVAKGINCGSVNSNKQPNGFEEQKNWFATIWRAVGDATVPKLDPAADGVLEEGERGDAVEDLQTRLLALGYPVGKPDGIYGQRTFAAVAALQAREGLGGEPGKYRLEWLPNLDLAKPFADDERRNATAADLAAEGHKPVWLLAQVKRGAVGLAGFLGFGQIFDGDAESLPGVVDSVRYTIEPLISTFGWLFSNRWAVMAVAALLVYFGANWLIGWFVKDHRTFGNAADQERAAA